MGARVMTLPMPFDYSLVSVAEHCIHNSRPPNEINKLEADLHTHKSD